MYNKTFDKISKILNDVSMTNFELISLKSDIELDKTFKHDIVPISDTINLLNNISRKLIDVMNGLDSINTANNNLLMKIIDKPNVKILSETIELLNSFYLKLILTDELKNEISRLRLELFHLISGIRCDKSFIHDIKPIADLIELLDKIIMGKTCL